MARLVNYGTGEALDRLSILSLKLLHATLAGKDADHFRNERNALLSEIRGKNGLSLWIEEYLQLGAVNAALWYAEDELRAYRATGPRLESQNVLPALHCAFRIQDLNDQRNALIAAINQKTGEHYGQEKLNG